MKPKCFCFFFQGPTYKCAQCDKVFANSSYLAQHTRIHLDIKPFMCDVENCEKSFRQAKDLTRHRRTHTGERPYS